jgi:hypothetical protein
MTDKVGVDDEEFLGYQFVIIQYDLSKILRIKKRGVGSSWLG